MIWQIIIGKKYDKKLKQEQKWRKENEYREQTKIRSILEGQIGHIKNQLLFQKIHDLLKIALCSLHTIMVSTIPSTNCVLDAIQRIVDRLNQEEHLLRLCNTESIRQCETLLALASLQNVITLCH